MRDRKPFLRSQDTTRINETIREKEVRVIDQDGNHLGVLSCEEALARAVAVGLDLVEVATGSAPHVCRIMDYGHYKFEQAKRQRMAKKKQKVIVIKEIKMRPRTDEHDYQFKLNHARRFLQQGFKVKFTILFRGREMTHKEYGRELLGRIENDLQDVAIIESKPKMEGRTIHMMVVPSSKPKPLRKDESTNDVLSEPEDFHVEQEDLINEDESIEFSE